MFDEILEYQKKEKELIDIERELGQSEERKRIARAKNFLQDVDKNIGEMDSKASQLNANFAKLKNKSDNLTEDYVEYQKMLEQTKSEDEINYFIKKIAQLEEQLGVAEKDIQQVIADVKELLISFDDYRKKVKAAKEEFEDYRAKFDSLKKSRQPEMNKISDELKKMEKKIPKDQIEAYKKVREKKIYPVFVPLSNEKMCSGCRMELSMNRVSTLNANGVVECEECGRLIFKQ